ncbi:hypothetical protein GGS20DRAFT_545752 [Poronia punctata]|nr:hypothetical protein GGS20DRAFT_545752 [Poronia punctata]
MHILGGRCDEPGCTFTTGNGALGLKGLSEHRSHRHIGRICFWPTADGGRCDFTAGSDEEFCEHFKTAHLDRAEETAPNKKNWQCPWPGCPKGFKTKQSAERHARQSQRTAWLDYQQKKREEEQKKQG